MRQSYFNNTCQVFANYDANRKLQFLTENNLCHVCSGSNANPNHKEADKTCPLADKLYCRTCASEGKEARSRTHHTEVHLDRRQAAKPNQNRKSKHKDDKGGSKDSKETRQND